MGTIALLTDFGLQDWYVGVMKGVIRGIAPAADIVDLTHGLPMGDITAGACALSASYTYFPAGTIFVVVVDPGVGSSRRALIASTSRYTFVGPDNGVLAPVLAAEQDVAVHTLTNPAFQVHPVSETFHGRDVFAPAAAHFHGGAALEKFGEPASDYVGDTIPQPTVSRSQIHGEVVYIDHFGNAMTNIHQDTLSRIPGRTAVVTVEQRAKVSLKQHYAQVARGEVLALIGSSGYVELSVNGGSAADVLGLKRGSPLTLS